MKDSDRPFIHPTAVIDEGARIAPSAKIWHFCHVMGGAVVGDGCVLGQNVYVAGSVVLGPGCRIQNNVSLYDGVLAGARVFIGPSAVFTNVTRPRAGFPRRDRFEPTVIGDDATVGANATILCGATLGEGSFVAAGAVVTRSVPPFVAVAGVPARPLGFVCRCGEALPPALRCSSCSRIYQPDGPGLREIAPP